MIRRTSVNLSARGRIIVMAPISTQLSVSAISTTLGMIPLLTVGLTVPLFPTPLFLLTSKSVVVKTAIFGESSFVGTTAQLSPIHRKRLEILMLATVIQNTIGIPQQTNVWLTVPFTSTPMDLTR